MANIHILDDITIDKIAAGEVVERPSSVVKELVENAIDANSKKIEVEILEGGKSFIRICDDGIGMNEKNARLSILRHATSKIISISDLEEISTLGFRGEALPSIAAVSKLTIKTRVENEDLGTIIKVNGGEIEEIDKTGSAFGTTMLVEDLFFNVPARKKFLKTNNTEANRITDFLIKLSLSKPDIAFKLISNNRLILKTPGNNSLFDAINSIYGDKVTDELLYIDFENDEKDIKITGFISKPAVIRASRSWQTTIVNNRIIQSKVIYKAIDNAYHSLLPKSGYPFLVLNIEIDKKTIDINVHPQKQDIKFADEKKIYKAVYYSLLKAILPKNDEKNILHVASPVNQGFNIKNIEDKNNIQYENNNDKIYFLKEDDFFNKKDNLEAFREVKNKIYNINSYLENKKNDDTIDTVMFSSKINETGYNIENLEEDIEKYNIAIPTDNINHQEENLIKQAKDIYPIGQIDKCFIVCQGIYGGMYIIDQHAAHERILYDKYAKQKENIKSQNLLIHIFLSLNSNEMEILENNKGIFENLGFIYELAGVNQIRLMAIPIDIHNSNAENVIYEIIKNLLNYHNPSIREIRHLLIATTACRAAIKAGDELTLSQMEVLIKDLANTTLPYTCPHGRPTILKFSSYDLEKMFKRVK